MIVRDDPRIDGAHAEIARVGREQRGRTYPDRLYRCISRQIDRACEEVERVNLDGGNLCPPEVNAFVVQLQRQAGEPEAPPRTTMQAHDELFRLSSVLLGRPGGDLECDIEAGTAQPEAER